MRLKTKLRGEGWVGEGRLTRPLFVRGTQSLDFSASSFYTMRTTVM